MHSTNPVAVYQVDKVLLPEAIFGTPPPPSPAPAPSPDIAPTADSPSGVGDSGSSPKSSTSANSSIRISSSGLIYFVMAIAGSLVVFL